jgi:hypothetical protein
MGMRIKNVKIYKLSLAVYAIGGISAIILSVLKGLNREDVGFAFLLATVLLAILIYLSKRHDPILRSEKNTLFYISIIAWPLIFLVSAYFLFGSFQNYYLSLGYFLSIAALTLIISYQILSTVKFTRLKVYTILAEIIILSFYLGASLISLYPAPLGNDAVVHEPFISSIVSSGNLQSDQYAGHYQNYPIYQLTFVDIMLISGVSIDSAELVLLLIQIGFTIFIYLIVKKIFSQRIALTAFLLINFSSQLITPRYSYYPSNFFIILFMILIFILLYFNKNNTLINIVGNNDHAVIQPQGIYSNIKSLTSRGITSLSNFSNPKLDFIAYILILTINLSHPIFALITTSCMAFIYAISRLTRSGGIISIKMILWSAILLFIQWLRPYYAPELKSLSSIFVTMATSAFLNEQVVTQATLSPYHDQIDIVLYELGFVLLIMLGVCGALWVLWDNEKNLYKYIDSAVRAKNVLSYFTLFIVPIPYVLAIVIPDFLPERLFVYVTLFIVILASVTLVTFYELFNRNITKFIIILAIPFIIFFSITSPTSNPNSHIYSQDLASRASLTHTDIGGRDFIRQYVNYSDFCANSNYAERITLTPNMRGSYLDPSHLYADKILVVRNYDMENGFNIPLFGKEGKLKETIMANSTFVDYLDHLNKLYENGAVRAFF